MQRLFPNERPHTPVTTTDRSDRIAGTILGGAVGDALGVPYEFEKRALDDSEEPQMLGGGLGSFAPGQWSDDTDMAMAILDVIASGKDLRSPAGQDAVAANFLQWYASVPADVGNQTSAVLSATRRRLGVDPDAAPGTVMREESLDYTARNPRSAGNGALMRTGPVALAYLDDPEALAETARATAGLTHAGDLAGDSCVLWCEAIRVAVVEQRLDVTAGLDLLPCDRIDQWTAWLDDAATQDPKMFNPNGFTVSALQAATSSILHTLTPDVEPHEHTRDALFTAIRIGNDTDTVAAIAGALLGARWGADAIADEWRQAVHGWSPSGPVTGEQAARRVVER